MREALFLPCSQIEAAPTIEGGIEGREGLGFRLVNKPLHVLEPRSVRQADGRHHGVDQLSHDWARGAALHQALQGNGQLLRQRHIACLHLEVLGNGGLDRSRSRRKPLSV